MNVNMDKVINSLKEEQAIKEQLQDKLEELRANETEEVIDDMEVEMTEESKRESLEGLLDLMGLIGGFDPETFGEEKEAIMESGVGLESFLDILGGNVIDKFGPREMVNMPIQLLTTTAKLPKYAHETDACADLYADETVTIQPGETDAIHTGVAIAVPMGYVVHLYPRSSTGLKTPLRLSNSVGVIDSGYRDELRLIFTNTGDKPFVVKRGDRIAQMCVDHSPMARFHLVPNIKDIEGDREGGLGSTGVAEMLGTAAEEAGGPVQKIDEDSEVTQSPEVVE